MGKAPNGTDEITQLLLGEQHFRAIDPVHWNTGLVKQGITTRATPQCTAEASIDEMVGDVRLVGRAWKFMC